MKKVYKFKAGVWLWPGVGAWHFINVPEKVSEEIRLKYGKGMIKVKSSVKDATWDTSLFPHKKSKGYLLCIKSSVRKKVGIYENDIIGISFSVV